MATSPRSTACTGGPLSNTPGQLLCAQGGVANVLPDGIGRSNAIILSKILSQIGWLIGREMHEHAKAMAPNLIVCIDIVFRLEAIASRLEAIAFRYAQM